MSQKPGKSASSGKIDELMREVYSQAKAQFGSVIKSYWFYDGGLCPGCTEPSDGTVKFKGKEALSLNAFVYRAEGVLIGYYLCENCTRQVHKAAQKNPYRQTPLHTQIEQHLIGAYHHFMRKHDD